MIKNRVLTLISLLVVLLTGLLILTGRLENPVAVDSEARLISGTDVTLAGETALDASLQEAVEASEEALETEVIPDADNPGQIATVESDSLSTEILQSEPQPASEPEVQWLVEQINNISLDVIVSIHAPFHLLVWLDSRIYQSFQAQAQL